MRLRSIIPILLACLVAPAFADGLPDLGEAAQADLSPQMEKRIGEKIMRDIRQRETAYIDDPEINGYLNNLGRKLAAQSEETHQEFEFFALRDPTLNAFAMPGGFIGVHTGLVEAAQSESELASVLAHEISHVTQRHLARMANKQSQSQLAALLSMAVALLAARSNPDAAIGAVVAGQAVGIQQQLNYSRDFEREADRLGLQLLEKAGYDIRDMGVFFERLQRNGRLYENSAPGYLRTHPLTTERIADMENRIRQRPYRQKQNSLEFLLVRAKLRVGDGAATDAVAEFQAQLNDGKFISEPAVRYGLARAHLRVGNIAAAEAELAEIRRTRAESPMIETLAAQLAGERNNRAGAIAILKNAHLRYPQDRAITYALIEAQLTGQRPADALKLTENDLLGHSTDYRIHSLQAQAYAQLGKRLQQHRSQAEAYALQGQLLAAIEQLTLAQRAPDGDYYEHSQVDARLRELKEQQAIEAKEANSKKS